MLRHEEELINFVRQTYGVTPTTIHQRQGSIRLIVPNEQHIFFPSNPPNPAICVENTKRKILDSWGEPAENQMAQYKKHLREIITWVQSEYGFTPKAEPGGSGHLKLLLTHGSRSFPPVTIPSSPTNEDVAIKNIKKDIRNILGAPTPAEPTPKRTLADMTADLKQLVPMPMPSAAEPPLPPKKPDPAAVGRAAMYHIGTREIRYAFNFPPEFAKKLLSKTFACTEINDTSWELKPSIIGAGVRKAGTMMTITGNIRTKTKPFGMTPADFIYTDGILLVSLKEAPHQINAEKSIAGRLQKNQPRRKPLLPPQPQPQPQPPALEPPPQLPTPTPHIAMPLSVVSLTARGKAILDQMREFEAATGYVFTKIRADDGTYKWILRAPTIE